MQPAPPGSADVVFDPAALNPEFHRLRTLLRARDWTGVRGLTDAADPGLRLGLIRTGAEELGALAGEDFLRYTLTRDPGDSTAAAMLGLYLIETGWAIRGGGYAKDVSRAQFDRFHDHLRRAEQVLIDGTARNPRDPALWVARITNVRGLGLGVSEGRRRYDRVSAAVPNLLPAQSQLLQLLCPKWSGSWEEAHGFARECLAAAPPGERNAVLVAEAHLEHWLALPSGEDAAYLRGGPVRAELHEAAQRSVWHPAFRRGFGWVGTMSTFAAAFSLVGDEPAAASMFSALGPYAAQWPWTYLGDPAQQIRAARSRAFATGPAR